MVAGLVDYAGLFPPASLSMADAVAAYASYLNAPETWILGRFVVPAARLDELAGAAAHHASAHAEPWPISVLLGDDVTGDIARVHQAGLDHASSLQVEAVELRAATPEAIRASMQAVAGRATVYVEVPIAEDPRFLLQTVRDVRARAKVRTGGVTTGAVPPPATLARFIARCAEVGVPFKATAGLHHSLRSEHRLTYEPDAPRDTMFGFLNVFAAAAFALSGVPVEVVQAVLEERDGAALRFGLDGLAWRDLTLSLDQLLEARATFAISFGSCSFREPVDDLHSLALL